MGYKKWTVFFVSSGGTSDNFINNSLISTGYIVMSFIVIPEKNCVLGRSYYSISEKMPFWNEIPLLSTVIVFRQQSPIKSYF